MDISNVLSRYFALSASTVLILAAIGSVIVYIAYTTYKESKKVKEEKARKRAAVRFISQNRHGEINPNQ